ncbi:GNAT family N-acetyltransferase [Paenibacillus sp. FSL E2-0201]|uniref:GNAT family N-acetyltransferase n=1 Tax=Paenibacillus sp. FSL E2-0201 TaxID=2954726 RepID=UPI0030DCEACE
MQLRLIKPAELDQAALLADSIFREPGAISMKELFPLIFRPGLSHSYAAITEDGTVAAFMGLVPSTIKTGDAILNVFSIGAVCTAPAFRGQGLAGQLLEKCQAHAAEAGASLIFVSGDRSLYTRAGCVPFGGTQFAELNESSAQALAAAAGEEWTLRPMQPGDFFAVNRLLNERETGHVYSPGELALLLGTEAYAGVLGLAQRTLVAVRDGSIEGFAAVAVPAAADVPAPSTATAVEWAGQPSAVAALLAKAALCGGVGALQVPVPWQERGLLALLREAGASLSAGANSGTVCIADRAALLRQTEGCRKGHDLSSVQDDKELISLLFDPASPLHTSDPSGESEAIPLPYMSGLHFI